MTTDIFTSTNSDWEELFEHFDKLNASKDQQKELEEEILWTEKHLKDLKQELKKLKEIS